MHIIATMNKAHMARNWCLAYTKNGAQLHLYYIRLYTFCVMASRKRRRECLRIETNCRSTTAKEALGRRLLTVQQLLTPSGKSLIDNETLLNALFDVVEKFALTSYRSCVQEDEPPTRSFQRSNGKTTNVIVIITIHSFLPSFFSSRYVHWRLLHRGQQAVHV